MATVMAAILLTFRLNGELSAYVDEVKAGRSLSVLGKAEENRTLREAIEAEAVKRRIAPTDARVDRVWKAIPGYNGVEIDVEKTYRLMKNAPLYTPISYVFKEVAPKVGLDDLGNHPIYQGNPKKMMVSLMINVAWGNEHLEPMLGILERERVKATFFLDGTWLKKNAEAARMIQSYGHEISNHAYSHPNMSQLSRGAQFSQIARTEALLKSTLGVTNRWFAPPSGDYNQLTVEVAAEHGLKTVLWTLDTVDWQHPPATFIVQKIRKHVKPGSLILMHPTDSSSAALEGIIKAIKDKGLALGTVSETLSSSRVPPVEAAH